LNAKTILSHKHHPEAIERYGTMPEYALTEGTLIEDHKGRLTVLFISEKTGAPWLMGLAPHEHGLRVATLHISDARKHRSFLRRGKVLRRGVDAGEKKE